MILRFFARRGQHAAEPIGVKLGVEESIFSKKFSNSDQSNFTLIAVCQVALMCTRI